MSCYNWESGTIKLPAKAWASFRTNLLKAWNAHYLRNLEKAKKAHAELKEACKGKRGKKREEALKAAVEKRFTKRQYQYGRYENVEVDVEIRRMVVTQEGWGERAKYTLKALPKKKDLPLHATSKDAQLDLGEATVVFKNAGKTVSWDVYENNRAVERAHEHWFAKKLFEALGKVTWTRGSGGKIVGNDEYNRDNRDAGGGGNYTTHEFSQAKQKRDREYARRNRSSFGGFSSRRYY